MGADVRSFAKAVPELLECRFVSNPRTMISTI